MMDLDLRIRWLAFGDFYVQVDKRTSNWILIMIITPALFMSKYLDIVLFSDGCEGVF